MLTLLWATSAFALDPIITGAPAGPLRQIGDGFTSAYVLDVGDGTAALFDTGIDPRASSLRAALDYLGILPENVTDIFLTHGHFDHIVGVSAFPGAQVHAHVEELSLLEDAGVEVTFAHLDGDLVEVGPYTVEVLHVPGHTPGHSAFLVDGALVLGDSLIVDGGRLRPIPPGFSDDPGQNIISLLDLATRLLPRRDEITHLAPMHSGLSSDPDRLFSYVD
ncbi:MAG: glyoxylase-like metal-dependent hydrolase (beta-lactamase superfamily II) [Myxococcota bacterium]|jgi:glyoxylase-like metal-dependent hydrolase (beta-lactamase superfamily II)